GVPGRRDLPRGPDAREVHVRAGAEGGVLRRAEHRGAHRDLMVGSRPRIAIVGAGPAGAFAAASLWRMHPDAEVDLFERLPTPWGLLRGGVAPDHQEIKRLDDTFDRETLERGHRLFANVEIGVDVSHDELMRHYAAVIYATGAQTDKSLGIPGEELPGSWAATEFVAWYNGHPDYRGLEFDLSPRRAVVIGNGNVAADVTRMLVRSLAELERTDARRRIVLRFLRCPVEIRGGGRVEAVDVGRNEIVQAGDGSLRPRPVDGDVETIECGLVLRSVGYRAVPLPGVPFDERSFVLPNDRGRVLGADGEPLPGVYAVGWIKRGPTGILGTNKRDADETVRCLVEDLAADRVPVPPDPDPEKIVALLAERNPDVVTVEGWRAIDADERQRGSREQRPRVKLSSRDELLAAAKPAAERP